MSKLWMTQKSSVFILELMVTKTKNILEETVFHGNENNDITEDD